MKYITMCKVLGTEPDSQQRDMSNRDEDDETRGSQAPLRTRQPSPPAVSEKMREGKEREQEKEKMAFFWVTSWPAKW